MQSGQDEMIQWFVDVAAKDQLSNIGLPLNAMHLDSEVQPVDEHDKSDSTHARLCLCLLAAWLAR